jgi:hypothetical protein
MGEQKYSLSDLSHVKEYFTMAQFNDQQEN